MSNNTILAYQSIDTLVKKFYKLDHNQDIYNEAYERLGPLIDRLMLHTLPALVSGLHHDTCDLTNLSHDTLLIFDSVDIRPSHAKNIIQTIFSFMKLHQTNLDLVKYNEKLQYELRNRSNIIPFRT